MLVDGRRDILPVVEDGMKCFNSCLGNRSKHSVVVGFDVGRVMHSVWCLLGLASAGIAHGA